MEIIDLRTAKAHNQLQKILSRNLSLNPELLAKVTEIINMVQQEGDQALCSLSQQLDGIALTPANIQVEPALIKELASQTSSQLIGFIRTAIENIREFHKHQLESSWEFTDSDGVTLGQRLSAIDSVGLYVPGGKAAYPSTLIMNAVPALTAGVKRIAVTTPPTSFMSAPVIAATLNELGITEVYTVGGAQAIAALAFGTETIPKVDKIVGPGNLFVAAAKKLVYGIVDIDAIAGPSEIVVLADESAPASYIAADMLAQAEHDSSASAILVTTSLTLAEEVFIDLKYQLATLPRKDIATESLNNYGAIFIVETMEQGCELVNKIAPEHVELMVEDPEEVAKSIRHAGAIFFGQYSCESVGDYLAGPNHVLPTGGTARFCSPLGVYDFMKRTNLIKYNKEKLNKSVAAIVGLADCEGLRGHALAAMARFSSNDEESRSTTPLPGRLPKIDLDDNDD